MLYNDLRVKRPEKTKLITQRECVYVYHVCDSKYNKEKQYVTEKRRMIGKMIDDEMMCPNDNYFELYPNETIKEEPSKKSDAIHVATTTLLLKIMDDLGLSQIIDDVHSDEADLIKDLVCYMIINHTSVSQHFPDFAWNHELCSTKIASDSKISKLYKSAIDFQDIEEFLLRWVQINKDKECVYISYDSTNMNTKAEGIEMAEFGHAKDEDDTPQVNISYVVNQNDATPLFYEMYPGSIIDVTQCKYMVDRINAYGYEKIGFILDRGYFSESNIRYFDANNYDFIMMVKNNSKFIKKQMDETCLKLKNSARYFMGKHSVFGMTTKGKISTKDKKERYFHIYYDDIRASEERNRYLHQVQKKEQLLIKKVDEKIRKEEELTSYRKHFKLRFDDYGYLLSYVRNDKKIQEDIDKLGYFVLITSQEMSASDALDIYRDRDSTEKLFRALKTGLDFDHFRVQSQSSLEGKMHILFIASIVRNKLFQELKKIKENDKKNYTVPASISELEKVIVLKDRNGKRERRYALTSKQKKILNLFDIDEEYLDRKIQS
jgi:transposase